MEKGTTKDKWGRGGGQVSYDGGGRRGAEERGPASSGGGGGSGKRRASAVGPGEPPHQQSRHVRGGELRRGGAIRSDGERRS
jgi:hypothetical protein